MEPQASKVSTRSLNKEWLLEGVAKEVEGGWRVSSTVAKKQD